MAELVLGNAGAALGQFLLPQGLSLFGAQIAGQTIGRAIGSLAGAYVDARYLTPPVEGPRIKEFHLTESREGARLPVVYGRMRVGAQVIWTAAFKERREVQGGKGGPRMADYSYTPSFAVALCEGEISRASRCWANGEPFDLSKATWRLYRGTEDQAPDPLIEAVEGESPAYRGVAYVVFEDLPVDAFGARMPQLSFEVVRPTSSGSGRLESVARAVNMIPGSGEFALSMDIVRRRTGPGRETPDNLHSAEAKSDFEASLDQIEAELPNVTRINLVVAWFAELSDGGVIRFEAMRAGAASAPVLALAAPVAPPVPAPVMEPDVAIVDAPPLPGQEDDLRPIGFAFAEPWTGPVTISAGADATQLTTRGRILRPCAMGRLETALHAFASGRWQEASVWVSLPAAGLSSRSESAVLNGANAALVETEAGWELIQFVEAELVDVERWKLTRLLRGQQGSEPANAAGAPVGARILF